MSEILVGEYLFRRLKELGIGHIFGVPGDYELALLDLIPKEGLVWNGSPNELVAAYSADGYARVKGCGALITTFGPGELSALCGVGGAYCEFVPIIHIVGYPTVQYQNSGKIFHHTLGDGSYDHYVKMSAELSCDTAVLKDPATAAHEIDRVLNSMLYHSQPGYIGISSDIAYAKINDEQLKVPLVKTLPANDPATEGRVIEQIIQKLTAAKQPVLMVDGGANRLSFADLANELWDALEIPAYATTLGKGILKETNSLFGGAYVGAGSPQSVITGVEGSDCILWLGNYPSDFNTGMFSEHFDPKDVVDFQRFYTMIGETKYRVQLVHLLPALIQAIRADVKLHKRGSSAKVIARDPVRLSKVPQITHEWFWQRFTPFFKPGDLIVTETGTSQFGLNEAWLPEGATLWTQAIYGSIGYASGAAVGGSVAAKELGKYKRMILITGEGSLQLTVQAFSILNRYGVVPLVIIINNDGYTVERLLHGLHAPYNTIPQWDYGSLFKAFAPEIADRVKTWKLDKAAEVDALLNDAAFCNADYPQCVEVVMDKLDYPSSFKALGM